MPNPRRLSLAHAPTPLLPDRGLREICGEEAKAPEIWVKREDLSGPALGGNKIRKLEFIIGEWRARNIREVITFGAVGTVAIGTGLASAWYGPLVAASSTSRCSYDAQ